MKLYFILKDNHYGFYLSQDDSRKTVNDPNVAMKYETRKEAEKAIDSLGVEYNLEIIEMHLHPNPSAPQKPVEFKSDSPHALEKREVE